MRRSVAFVLGTVAGTSLLVSAKLGVHSPAMPSAADDSAVGVTVGGSPATTGSPAPRATPSDDDAPMPSPHSSTTRGSAPGPGTPSPTHVAVTPKPKPSVTPTPSGPKDGTYTASAPVRGGQFGSLSMTVTISGNRITNIAGSETNPSEPSCYHSACPKLKSEALTAQSASIAAVSGATYTSQAYETALAAVLSAAKS